MNQEELKDEIVKVLNPIIGEVLNESNKKYCMNLLHKYLEGLRTSGDINQYAFDINKLGVITVKCNGNINYKLPMKDCEGNIINENLEKRLLGEEYTNDPFNIIRLDITLTK